MKHYKNSFPVSKIFLFGLSFLAVAAISILLYLKKPAQEKRQGVIVAEADGSVWQIADYIKQNLKDPESFQAVHWSNLSRQQDLSGDSAYSISVVYRAKNDDGKIVMSSKRFDFDRRGTILFEIGVQPFQDFSGNR